MTDEIERFVRGNVYADECVRHKVLDAIGDLALAGLPLMATYRSKRGGHKLNHAVLSALMADPTAWRVVEAWGDDVPHGKRTDFHRATEATSDETIVFSWAEWPDRQTRDAAHAAMEKLMSESGEPMDMPFDGARMITGGFATLLDLGGRA